VKKIKVKPIRLLLGAVGLAIGVAGVMALREATLSTHEDKPSRAVEVVVSAKTKGGEHGQSLEEMVEAQLLTCRLEVTSDLDGDLEAEPEDLGEGHFRAVLVPGLDQTNRRQFRGCVEDWVIDHVRIDVVEMNDLT
jgi:hypothetical protein